jgi:hypothetical protein
VNSNHFLISISIFEGVNRTLVMSDDELIEGNSLRNSPSPIRIADFAGKSVFRANPGFTLTIWP